MFDPLPYRVSLVTDDEGLRTWEAGTWDDAYADARAASTEIIGASSCAVHDATGALLYRWETRASKLARLASQETVLEPARVHAMTYRYTPRVAS